MISNIEILYGLANRCINYGIKNSRSKSDLIPLDKILGVCDGVDGAEKYKWDPNDLSILKNYPGMSHFTKIDIKKNNLDQIIKIIQSHSQENNSTYLKGFYIHNKVDENTIDIYKKYRELLKNRFDIKMGFSIYKQEEVNLIKENELILDILQIPHNFNVEIDLSSLDINTCHVYLRSIFLQGAYFSNINNKFNKKTISRITKQKSLLSNIASSMGFELGQYLFSEAVSYCKLKKYKGVVIGSSSINRLFSYVRNHKFIKTFEINRINNSDIIDDHLADPRKWKR